MNRPKRLDEYWELGDFHCPFCKTFMWHDNHENLEATHYCKVCDEGFVISGACMLRNEMDYEA